MKTLSGKPISRIGIGSYGIGGRGHRDMTLTEAREDKEYVDAIVYTLQKQINFTEISLGYGHGKALSLFKEALDKSLIKREDIFLTNSLYPRDLPNLEAINEDIASFYRIMATDYADSTLITQSLIVKFGQEAVYPLLHELLKASKTKYVSLSNASPSFIKAFKEEFNDKFVAHEGHLSFEVRALQDKGVFDTCSKLNVENIIWRPLRRNKTMELHWPLLVELTGKYQKMPNQIVLNWIFNLGYYPMVMSASKNHIDENITAIDFQMSDEDYKRMTDFRPSNYHPPEVDWEKNGKGDSIVTLVNDFEKHIG